MGRKKNYDPQSIARKAMNLFWFKGYNGTSTQDLVHHLGINRFSLYAEFGSKQSLYEAAQALYNQEVVARHFGRLEKANAGITEIESVFEFFGKNAAGPGSENGCFLCNVATESAPHDPASRVFTDAYVARIANSFRNALDNEKTSGQLDQTVHVRDEASYLVSMMLGIFVLMRSQTDPEIIQGTVRSAIAHLDRLRASK